MIDTRPGRAAARTYLERHRRFLVATGAPSFTALAQLFAHLAEVERALAASDAADEPIEVWERGSSGWRALP